MPPKNIITNQKINPAKLQRAKELRRESTPAEQILWQALRRNQLGGFHFRRQQVIGGFIADFYCHAAGLVVEVDGGIHHRQAEYDRERDKIVSTFGVRILRIQNEDVVNNLAGVLNNILQCCHIECPRSWRQRGDDRDGYRK